MPQKYNKKTYKLQTISKIMQEEIKVNANEIMIKLARLQSDMNYVREHIEDITLTEDDLRSLEEAEKEYKEGKTTSLEDLKKELGM